MNKIHILWIFILIAFSVARADELDVVYLKDGTVIKGRIIELIINQHIKIESLDGTLLLFPYEKVEKYIKVLTTKELDDSINAKKKNYKFKDYFELGAVLYGPTRVSLVFGYWTQSIGLRLSGMFFSDKDWGCQFDFGIPISDGKHTRQSINLFGEISHLEAYNSDSIPFHDINMDDTSIIGVAYNLNAWGFHLQAGIGYKEGWKNRFDLSLQLGYVYRFNN